MSSFSLVVTEVMVAVPSGSSSCVCRLMARATDVILSNDAEGDAGLLLLRLSIDLMV